MPAPSGVAGQFLDALFASHYLNVIFLLQVIPAILLLLNRYVSLALTFLGPVIVNIVCFHVFTEPSGIPLALITVILWVVVYFDHRFAFAGLFRQRVKDQSNARREIARIVVESSDSRLS